MINFNLQKYEKGYFIFFNESITYFNGLEDISLILSEYDIFQVGGNLFYTENLEEEETNESFAQFLIDILEAHFFCPSYDPNLKSKKGKIEMLYEIKEFENNLIASIVEKDFFNMFFVNQEHPNLILDQELKKMNFKKISDFQYKIENSNLSKEEMNSFLNSNSESYFTFANNKNVSSFFI